MNVPTNATRCRSPDGRGRVDAFARRGLQYKPYRSGARIGDLGSPQTVKPSEVDRALTVRAMTGRVGPYETSAQARDRAAARETYRSRRIWSSADG